MLFGSSGIRQRFDARLVEIALAAGAALGARSAATLIGTDTRTTSPILKQAVISGILGSGGSASDAGIAPTPSIAFTARNFSSACMITASHNPEEYNGIKLFNPDGSSCTRSQQADIEERMKKPHWADWNNQGCLQETDAVTPHKEAILSRIDIRKEIPVVLDCGNGAGCRLTPSLLAAAGVRVTGLNCNPSGHFSRPSEPLKEHLGYMPETIKRTGAIGAVIHDGDADRMMAFDNRGRYIDGDHLLMLFVQYTGAKRVVTTSDASMIIEEIAEVRRTPVGDSFVSEELLHWGDLGGEPSGAWIFPGLSYCPDGPFAAALFCEISSEWDVAEELDRMPAYPILRESIALETARETVAALGALNPTDGIRIEEVGAWCLIRASGTEPKIRITAEGKTREAASAMLRRGHALVNQAKTA